MLRCRSRLDRRLEEVPRQPRDYAKRLRTEPNAQLLLDRSELGDSVDKTIQIFSQVNEIPSCDTPGDVG
jgi:hypothetical protein